MVANKKKLSKKEIKEDKLVELFMVAREKFKEYYEQYSALIIGGSVLVVAIIAGIFWYSNKLASDNLAAGAEISRVMDAYNQGNYQLAIDGQDGTPNLGFEKIVDLYGSSSQGQLAKIYLANCYYFLGDYANAKEYYANYSGSEDVLIAAAYAGQAACEAANGNSDSAAELYLKAAKVSKVNPNNANNYLMAGKLFIEAGDKDAAEKAFDIIEKEYKTASAFRELDKYKSLL